MLFIDWRSLIISFVLCSIVAIAIVVIWRVRKKGLWLSVPVYVAAVPVGSAGLLALMLFLMTNMSGCRAFESPVYSPDGRSAARIEHYDAGATGGDSVVVLYTDHGFRTKQVFFGGFHSVDPTNLTWPSDSDLVIGYSHWQGYDEESTCSGMGPIQVHCVPK